MCWFMSFERTSLLWSVVVGKVTFSIIEKLKHDFCTAPSLTMHTLSAKGLTQNYYQSVCVVRATFAESCKNCSKHLLRVCFMDNLAFALWLLCCKVVKTSSLGFFSFFMLNIHFLAFKSYPRIRACVKWFNCHYIDQTFSDECHFQENNINFMTILLLFVNFPLHNVLRCFYQSNSLLATFGLHPAFYHVFRMHEAKFI